MLHWLERMSVTSTDATDSVAGQLRALILEAKGGDDVTWMAAKVQAVKAQFSVTCKDMTGKVF